MTPFLIVLLAACLLAPPSLVAQDDHLRPNLVVQTAWYSPVLTIGHHDRLIATGSEEGEIVLWSVPELREVRSMKVKRRVLLLRFLPDETLLSVDHSGAASVWECSSGKKLREFSVIMDPKYKFLTGNGHQNPVALSDSLDTLAVS